MGLFSVVPRRCLHSVKRSPVDTKARTCVCLRKLLNVTDVVFKNFNPNVLVVLEHVFEVILLVRQLSDVHFVWEIIRFVEGGVLMTTRNHSHC